MFHGKPAGEPGTVVPPPYVDLRAQRDADSLLERLWRVRVLIRWQRRRRAAAGGAA